MDLFAISSKKDLGCKMGKHGINIFYYLLIMFIAGVSFLVSCGEKDLKPELGLESLQELAVDNAGVVEPKISGRSQIIKGAAQNLQNNELIALSIEVRKEIVGYCIYIGKTAGELRALFREFLQGYSDASGATAFSTKQTPEISFLFDVSPYEIFDGSDLDEDEICIGLLAELGVLCPTISDVLSIEHFCDLLDAEMEIYTEPLDEFDESCTLLGHIYLTHEEIQREHDNINLEFWNSNNAIQINAFSKDGQYLEPDSMISLSRTEI